METVNIDQKQVKELREVLEDGFTDFIQVYFSDYEEKEKALQTALQDKNIENVIKIAHALKGSCLSVGAVGLAKMCAEIESAGKKGNYENTVTQYEGLQKIYPAFKKEYLRLIS